MSIRIYRIMLLALAAALVTSCGDDGGSQVNLPPDTRIVIGPQQGGTSSFQVEIHWTGDDPDGRVDAYEFAWLSGPAPMNGLDTLLTWEYTKSTDSVFTVLADSCCIPGGRYHSYTFFVRAIDDNGERDPSPESRSFTATTILPRAEFTYPTGGFRHELPGCVKLKWTGTDEDGKVVEYRIGKKTYFTAPIGEPPDLEDPTRWTDWTTDTELTDRLEQVHPDNPWTFFIQAKDDAGAVETLFDWGRNAMEIIIDETAVNLPDITLECRRGSTYVGGGELLGSVGFGADTTAWDVPIEVTVGDTICFRATYEEGYYADEVTHVRFLVNDPGEPGGWDSADPAAGFTDYPAAGETYFRVQAYNNRLYVWVKDDYCLYGSTRRIWMTVRGVWPSE
jgi:hypothetical protein